MNNRYVVTGFDENYCNWGLSWIISLKELANYQDNILIVDLGLSTATKIKLTDFGAYILPCNKITENMHVNILYTVCEFSRNYPGIFAVWDSDVYFQDNIDEIFENYQKFIVSKNPGFYLGNQKDFARFKEIQDLICFIEGDINFFKYISQFQEKEIDNTWNFTDVANLQLINNKLCYHNEIQKVIHPSGPVKNLLNGKNIAFWDLHKDLYNKYSDTKFSSFRKLIPKTVFSKS